MEAKWPGGWLELGEAPEATGRARIIGSLNSDAAEVLLDAVDSGVAELDISQLDPIDDSAIRVLAGLWPSYCTLVGSPPGLEGRLARLPPAADRGRGRNGYGRNGKQTGGRRAVKKINMLLAGLAVLPLVMAASYEWSWREGRVDILDAYVVLMYGAPDADPQGWTSVARVGPPRGRMFPVQWLVSRKAEENRDAVEAVLNDLDFYLKDVTRPDPWSDFLHHCDTLSNWYGHVHWVCVSRIDQPAHP